MSRVDWKQVMRDALSKHNTEKLRRLKYTGNPMEPHWITPEILANFYREVEFLTQEGGCVQFFEEGDVIEEGHTVIWLGDGYKP